MGTYVIPENRRYPVATLAAELGMTVPALCAEMKATGSLRVQYGRDGLSRRVAERWAHHFNLPAPGVWVEMVDHDIEDYCGGEDEEAVA